MTIVLVGDVVESRRYVDQVALLRAMDGLLASVNEAVAHHAPLRLAERDEFHAVYPTVATAVEAALRLRLAAAGLALATVDGEDEPLDVRVGLGQGEIVPVGGGQPFEGRSGSAWWCARDALEAAFELPRKTHWPPSIRTVFRSEVGGLDGAVNAYLLCQDQLFARMDLRDRRALVGLLDGERQVDVATALGITQPAVARRLRDRGALAIKRGLEALQTQDAVGATTAPEGV